MELDSLRAQDPASWIVNAVRLYGIENIFKRFYGFYRAKVIDNVDPENRHRIRVMCPALGQTKEEHVPKEHWCVPCIPGLSVGDLTTHGFFFPPEIGDEIWIAFEHGDFAYPIYIGGWLKADYETDDFAHEEKKLRGIRTSAGHYIQFSDDSKNNDVRITIKKGDGDGKQSGSTISLDHDGSVHLESDDGSKVHLNAESGDIEVTAEDNTLIKVGNDLIEIKNKTGSYVKVEAGNIEMKCTGNVTIDAAKVTISAQAVDIGKGGLEPAVKGQSFAQSYGLHQHVSPGFGAMGPPPNPPPPTPGKELSTVVKIA